MKAALRNLALCFFFTGITNLNAQYKYSITGFIGKSDYLGDHGQTVTKFDSPQGVLGFDFNYQFKPQHFLVLHASNGNWSGVYNSSAGENEGLRFNRGFRLLNLAYRYHLNPVQQRPFSPFIGAGFGIRFVSGAFLGQRNNDFFTGANMQSELAIPVFAGVDYKLSERLSMRYQFTLGWTSSDNVDSRIDASDNISILENDFFAFNTLGLTWYFNKRSSSSATNLRGEIGRQVLDGSSQIDSDRDGIVDRLDRCPNQFGEMSAKGCPDSDNDGIVDSLDACLNDKGLAQFKGCPDSDKDGVQDSEDECPELYGKIQFKGCPDSDGDGIEDRFDRCPINTGAKENNGCPDFIPATNISAPTNKSSIPASQNIGNTNNPAQTVNAPVFANQKELERFEELSRNERMVFNFPFDKEKVYSDSSLNAIDAMSNLMRDDQSLKLTIEGHCDEFGTPTYNYQLGLKRAEYVKAKIVAKGVKATRIKTTSMGSQKPLATGNSAPARRINRRVEFILSH